MIACKSDPTLHKKAIQHAFFLTRLQTFVEWQASERSGHLFDLQAVHQKKLKFPSYNLLGWRIPRPGTSAFLIALLVQDQTERDQTLSEGVGAHDVEGVNGIVEAIKCDQGVRKHKA